MKRFNFCTILDNLPLKIMKIGELLEQSLNVLSKVMLTRLRHCLVDNEELTHQFISSLCEMTCETSNSTIQSDVVLFITGPLSDNLTKKFFLFVRLTTSYKLEQSGVPAALNSVVMWCL